MSNLDIAIDSLDELLKEESGSKDHSNRVEVPWEKREEDFLKRIISQCEQQAQLHRTRGKLFKKLYMGLGIPTVLIPIIMSSLNREIEGHPLIRSFLMIFIGLISGTSSFLNPGRRYEEYFSYENQYNALAQDIRVELTKPKKHRIAVDVYLERVRLRFTNLDSNAPDV